MDVTSPALPQMALPPLLDAGIQWSSLRPGQTAEPERVCIVMRTTGWLTSAWVRNGGVWKLLGVNRLTSASVAMSGVAVIVASPEDIPAKPVTVPSKGTISLAL